MFHMSERIKVYFTFLRSSSFRFASLQLQDKQTFRFALSNYLLSKALTI